MLFIVLNGIFNLFLHFILHHIYLSCHAGLEECKLVGELLVEPFRKTREQLILDVVQLFDDQIHLSLLSQLILIHRCSFGVCVTFLFAGLLEFLLELGDGFAAF